MLSAAQYIYILIMVLDLYIYILIMMLELYIYIWIMVLDLIILFDHFCFFLFGSLEQYEEFSASHNVQQKKNE